MTRGILQDTREERIMIRIGGLSEADLKRTKRWKTWINPTLRRSVGLSEHPTQRERIARAGEWP